MDIFDNFFFDQKMSRNALKLKKKLLNMSHSIDLGQLGTFFSEKSSAKNLGKVTKIYFVQKNVSKSLE